MNPTLDLTSVVPVSSHVVCISPQTRRPGCLLAAMADVAALQAKLEALGWLAARLEQHRVAVGVAVELLHRRLLDGRTAAGAGVAAGGAQGVEAGAAGLQQTQEQHGALARQARQQQLQAGV